jgi:hypothetical protein
MRGGQQSWAALGVMQSEGGVLIVIP